MPRGRGTIAVARRAGPRGPEEGDRQVGTIRDTFHDAGLNRRGAAELIAQQLRQRIVDGELGPGEPLREAELAEAFGVARNTVREALRLLTQERIAVHEVHRGVAVRRLNPDEVRDIYAVRALLEKGAADRAGTLTPSEISRLRGIAASAEAAVQQGDAKAVQTLNAEFHRQLVGLLGNARLDQLFEQLLGEIRLILTGFIGRDQQWPQRNARLVQLLADGDRRGFEEELAHYLQDSCDAAVARLQLLAESAG
jgi:DNA-binding GntR family transcriptional regulator